MVFQSSFHFAFRSAVTVLTAGLVVAAQEVDSAINSSGTGKNGKGKRHTPDQEAISDLAKESGKRGGVSNSDADTLLEWADEYGFPARDDRGKDHWEGGNHIHIGPGHLPVK